MGSSDEHMDAAVRRDIFQDSRNVRVDKFPVKAFELTIIRGRGFPLEPWPDHLTQKSSLQGNEG